MITILYRLLVAFILVFVVINLFEEEDILEQANAALVVIPLLMRALMIK